MPDATADDETADDHPGLCCHRTRPGRTVFTEPDNKDGWLSTDLTVDVRR